MSIDGRGVVTWAPLPNATWGWHGVGTTTLRTSGIRNSALGTLCWGARTVDYIERKSCSRRTHRANRPVNLVLWNNQQSAR